MCHWLHTKPAQLQDMTSRHNPKEPTGTRSVIVLRAEVFAQCKMICSVSKNSLEKETANREKQNAYLATSKAKTRIEPHMVSRKTPVKPRSLLSYLRAKRLQSVSDATFPTK